MVFWVMNNEGCIYFTFYYQDLRVNDITSIAMLNQGVAIYVPASLFPPIWPFNLGMDSQEFSWENNMWLFSSDQPITFQY